MEDRYKVTEEMKALGRFLNDTKAGGFLYATLNDMHRSSRSELESSQDINSMLRAQGGVQRLSSVMSILDEACNSNTDD